MGTVRGVTIGPITAIHQDPPALDVGGDAFLVAHPALLSGLKLEDRVIVVWEKEGPVRHAVRITLQGAHTLSTDGPSPPRS